MGQWALKECKECQDLMDQKDLKEKLDLWFVNDNVDFLKLKSCRACVYV